MRHVVFVMSCAAMWLQVGAARAQGEPPGPTPPAAAYPSGAEEPAASAAPPPASAAPPPVAAYPGGAEEPAASAPEVRTEWRPSDPGFILGVERLVGIYAMSTSGNAHAVTVLSLAGNTGFPPSPLTSPQLSAHGVVGSGLTLGGGISFSRWDPGTGSNDAWTAFTISPRIGFLVALSPSLAIWAKGGISFVSMSFGKDPITWTELSLDPVLAFFPIPHVGLLVGPAVDIGLSSSNNSSSTSSKLSNYGVSAGLAVFL
jgi:hypothetical protein